jgi:hypothetical protein
LLRHGTNLVDVSLQVSGNESAVSTHATLEIDKMVVMANATDVLLDLFALPSEPLVFPTGRLKGLLGLLQAHGVLWGTAWSTLFGFLTGVCRLALQPFELLCGVANGLERRPLFGSHGTRNGFHQFGVGPAFV